MKNAMNAIIIKTAIWSFIGTFIVFGYGLGLFAYFFPRPMANLALSLGNQNMAMRYHERIFLRSDCPEDLYWLVDLAIAADDNRRILLYAPKILEHPYVIEIMNGYRFNESKHLGSLAALFSNEDNRIRSALIEALLAGGNRPQAKIEFHRAIHPDNTVPANPSYAFDLFNAADRVFLLDYYRTYILRYIAALDANAPLSEKDTVVSTFFLEFVTERFA